MQAEHETVNPSFVCEGDWLTLRSLAMQVRLAKEARDHADIAVQREPSHDLAHHMVGRCAVALLSRASSQRSHGLQLSLPQPGHPSERKCS